jgi:hypothetical protein
MSSHRPPPTWDLADGAVLPFVWDWGPWLAGEGVAALTGHTVTVLPLGLTVGSTAQTDTTVTAWLSGGVLDEWYTVTCSVTAGARQDERSLRVHVVENR